MLRWLTCWRTWLQPVNRSVTCTGDAQKRLAALEVLITLFRVYFAINNLRLCKNLVSAVDSRQFPPFDAFPASQRVTYKYFLGRIQILDEHHVRLSGWHLTTPCSERLLAEMTRQLRAAVEDVSPPPSASPTSTSRRIQILDEHHVRRCACCGTCCLLGEEARPR